VGGKLWRSGHFLKNLIFGGICGGHLRGEQLQ
jgi:hypothetical protein